MWNVPNTFGFAAVVLYQTPSFKAAGQGSEKGPLTDRMHLLHPFSDLLVSPIFKTEAKTKASSSIQKLEVGSSKGHSKGQ